jgi:hypothetical protein
MLELDDRGGWHPSPSFGAVRQMTSEQMMMGMVMMTSDATQDIRHNTNKNEGRVLQQQSTATNTHNLSIK